MISVDEGPCLFAQHGVRFRNDVVHGETEVLQKIFDRR
jgi:hypothetical protein